MYPVFYSLSSRSAPTVIPVIHQIVYLPSPISLSVISGPFHSCLLDLTLCYFTVCQHLPSGLFHCLPAFTICYFSLSASIYHLVYFSLSASIYHLPDLVYFTVSHMWSISLSASIYHLPDLVYFTVSQIWSISLSTIIFQIWCLPYVVYLP